MVKNCYGFISRKYRLRPQYIQEGHSWCAIFLHPTEKIKYKIKIFADLMDDYKTGKYLHLYKRTPNSDWQDLDGFTSIRSAVERLQHEMGYLKVEELPHNKKGKSKNIADWL